MMRTLEFVCHPLTDDVDVLVLVPCHPVQGDDQEHGHLDQDQDQCQDTLEVSTGVTWQSVSIRGGE